MTAITFTLKTALRQRLDVSPLTPQNLTGKELAQVAAIELQYGNRTLPTGHFFEVRGVPEGDGVQFTRGDRRFDSLGRGMTSGCIHVAGDVGAYLGYQMRGGRITVEGDAGIFCGAEMRDGEIRVQGNAGDFLGGALPGNRKGMSGGCVVVSGRAGDRVGDHMRRGLIIIEGDAGAYAGSRMIAGTIAIRGKPGPHPGYAMKRGTLLLAEAPAALPVTFNDCGTHTLGFLPLLLRSRDFASTAFADFSHRTPRVRRYAGDQASLGKGEILVLLSADH